MFFAKFVFINWPTWSYFGFLLPISFELSWSRWYFYKGGSSPPGTVRFAFKCYYCQAKGLPENHLESKQRLPMLTLDCFLYFLSDFRCLDWKKEKTLSRTSLHRSRGRWNWLLSHFVIPYVVFKTRVHFQFILLNFALETLRFTITKLCFFSKAGGDFDTSEAAALAS